MSSRFLSILVSLVLLLAVVAGVWLSSRHESSGEPGAKVVKLSDRAIQFSALVNVQGFHDAAMSGYHAVVFQGGRASDASLFRAEVTDTQVLDALVSLGARPGNGLGLDTWEERRNQDHPAADKIIAGPTVEVFVRLPGTGDPVPLESIIEDPGGRGLDMKFGGHRANTARWKSGCILCLYSCPGSKVGNARYTVRDFVKRKTRFHVKTDTLPPDGTQVEIIFRLAAADTGE